MKEQIIGRLNAVLNALESISVSGRANLANLSGSISVLEEVAQMLRGTIITSDCAPMPDEDKEQQ